MEFDDKVCTDTILRPKFYFRTLVDYERKIRDLERNLKIARKDITVNKTQAQELIEENEKLK